MGFLDAIKSGFLNYANFRGRASRSELWYWQLFILLVGTLLGLLDEALSIVGPTGFGPLYGLFAFVSFLPGMAVVGRRLHDVNISAKWYLVIGAVMIVSAVLAKITPWWYLIYITVAGMLLVLYWFLIRGTVGPNRFGEDPLIPAVLPVEDEAIWHDK